MPGNECNRSQQEPRFRGWGTKSKNKTIASVPFPVEDQTMRQDFELSRYSPVVKDIEKHLFYIITQSLSKPKETTMGFKGTWKPAINWGHDMLHSPLEKYIKQAGLDHFCKLKVAENSNRKLILSLVERWWDSTHTFHFPCAELGLTPLDFTMLTGLSVGKGACLKYDKKYENFQTAKLYLPLLEEKDILKHSISMSHLYKYKDWILDPSPNKKEACARAFFLYLLGQCIISGSNSRIRLGFLATVIDLGALDNIDWGGAAYSHLIASMDIAVRPGQLGSKAVTGCWQILEFWFYTYTVVTISPTVEDTVHTFPYINKWDSGNRMSMSIDNLSRMSIKWLPWHDSPYLKDPVVQPALKLLDRRVIITSYLVDVWYLGERCGMQITGQVCVPDDPPEIMDLRGKHGDWLDTWIASDGIAASTYRCFVSDEQYTSYWNKVSSSYLLPKLFKHDPLPMKWMIPITSQSGQQYSVQIKQVQESELPPIPKLSQVELEAKLRESMLMNISLSRMYAEIAASISLAGTPFQAIIGAYMQQPTDSSDSHPERQTHVDAYFPDMSEVQEPDSSGSDFPWFE